MTARAQLRPQAADAGSHSASGAIDDVRQPMAFADGMGVNGVQMKDAPAPAPKKGKDESKDVGELDGLGKKFQKKAGGLLEKVAREPGQTGRLSVFTNVPIDGAGFIKASFKFMGQVSRGADGKVTMKASVGGGVSAGKEIDLYFATIKAFAAAQVYGYIEAKGDTGEECFQLMALGIHRRLAKINKKLANAVVGKGTVEAAVAGMDDEDYVETGMGVEGVVGAGGEIHPDQDVGGWASAGRQSGERVSKGDDGELKTEKYNQMSQSIGTWLPPFRLSGSYTAKKKDGAMAGIDMSLTGGAMMSIGDIEGRLAGGTFVLDALSRPAPRPKAGRPAGYRIALSNGSPALFRCAKLFAVHLESVNEGRGQFGFFVGRNQLDIEITSHADALEFARYRFAERTGGSGDVERLEHSPALQLNVEHLPCSFRQDSESQSNRVSGGLIFLQKRHLELGHPLECGSEEPRLVSAGDGFTAPITLHYLRFSRLAELELHAVVGERTLPHGRLRSRVGKPNGAILRAHVAGRAEVDRQVLHRLGRSLTNKHSPLRKTFLRFVFQDNRGSQRVTAGATGA